MQNKTTKPEKTLSLSNLPSLIIAVVLIIGIGAIYGVFGYLFSGIKENVTPAIQKPSLEIADNYFGNEFIQIKSPQKNATIKSPVLISGKANVYEANVRIRISDNNKNILADTFITAGGWMDKLYLFEKEIDYKTPQTENGLIEIFEESVKDGSEIYKVEVPVVFGEYEDAFSDWEIYRNEEYGFEVKHPNSMKIVTFPNSDYQIDFRGNSEMNYAMTVTARVNPKVSNKISNPECYREINTEMLNNIKWSVNDYLCTIGGKISTICYSTVYDNNVFEISFRGNDLTNKISKLNQILSSFKFIEEDETADGNKPSIYSSKGGGGGLLLLNGEKTGFPAYEFEEENFILFTDRKIGDYKTRVYSLKTVSTEYPFEEKILSGKIQASDFYIDSLFEEEGLYFAGIFGDGPGSYTSIFMFEPESKEFIHCIIVRKFMSDIDIKIASSKSSVLFNAERKPRKLLGEDEDFLSDDDIEIIINDEKLSKKDVDDGHLIESQEAIFDCRPQSFMIPENDYYDHPDRYLDNYEERINRGEMNIRRYVEYFPNKFPCFVNEESDEITGYFDLVENKFVPALDL